MIKTILLTLFLAFSSLLKAETLKVVTTEFPPFQILNKEGIEGISTEVVREVIKNAGFESEIKVYPWPRAYKIASNEPNVVIYSIVKNAEREKLFKWIGIIAPFDVYFWKLAERTDIKINSLSDAKKYLVGGVNSDIKAAYLESEGFIVGKNLSLVNSDELNLKMLYAKRIDILPADEFSFPYRAKVTGYDLAKFSRLFKLKGIPTNLFMAASSQTSDEVVKKLQKSLADFHKTKKFRKIQKQVKNWSN